MSSDAARRTDPGASTPLPPLEAGAVVALCAAKILLHVFTSLQRYGYFRDELYYLDMARHLDFGYVDAAPLIAVYARIALALGGSLAALRVLPALAGAGRVALAILLAREVGGRRFAQWLAGLLVMLAPAFLVTDSLMTMNAFESLFWMGGALVLARIVRTGRSRLWPWFGLLMGLGLENKHSTLFFGASVFAALLLTRWRRELLRPWIWIAAGIAFALFVPNLVWQARHHFATLEDLENVRRLGKNVVLGPLAFAKQQIFDLQPLFFPIWLAGVVSFLRSRTFRILGFTFVVFFAVMDAAHAKDYYVFPIYPMVLAGGAAALERWTSRRSAVRIPIVAVLVAGALVTLPLATWMLPPEKYIAYEKALGFKPQKAEYHHEGPLPQPIGDQFGWPELAADVAKAYRSLPPEDRAHTGILAGNYGEAGAINLFGPALGLPRAYSRHQNYWFWGPPDQQYTNLIFLQFSEDDTRDDCASYAAFPHENPYGMAEENTPIYLCRGATFDLRKVWWHYHHWN